MAKNNKGQGLIEYLILVCVVSVAAIGVVSVVGRNIREQYANISHALQKKQRIELTKPDSRTYQERGMNDFMEGAD
jgi:pilus assembly protein Flp/PilA